MYQVELDQLLNLIYPFVTFDSRITDNIFLLIESTPEASYSV